MESKPKLRILIVDDETSVRTALVQWFTMRGFEVDQAADGLEAVHRCSANVYDVITMDLEMPRMGGIEAIKAIRITHPNIPIVVLTGFQGDNLSVPMDSIAALLTKPLRPSELEKHIHQVLQIA